ncbi:MAG: flavin reductase family protein [Gemmatimonadetes bacterium]|nr:flavin reductase family protein [Gemmatimonadota bacterium]
MTIATASQFRLLLSGFATGVTVATALDEAGLPHGMTASAVSAVSLEPPLLLLCVDRAADFHGVIARVDRFALSVLASDQEYLSRRFSDEPMGDRFAGIALRAGADGLPLIEGAVAHILCTKWASYDVGDHTVVVGQVRGGEVFDGRPLIHYRRGYTTTADR